VKHNKSSDQVFFSKHDVGGQARVTTDEEQSAARRLNRDEVMKVWRMGGCENFVG